MNGCCPTSLFRDIHCSTTDKDVAAVCYGKGVCRLLFLLASGDNLLSIPWDSGGWKVRATGSSFEPPRR